MYFQPKNRFPPGLFFDAGFVSPKIEGEIKDWLGRIYPIWENRYAPNHPPPPGKEQRQLLRPVYWLGNWQFACLNYYHPPRNIKNCCIQAEPYPPVLAKVVDKIEKTTRRIFSPKDIPQGWHLNTCLVNLYGSRLENGKWVDTARVGEHKDFEPGPVASVSLGERAMFQFVESRGTFSNVVFQQWLTDRSLQIFGGYRWKEKYFHRVQRVDKREKIEFNLPVENFRVRRVNFTFRYVPDSHIIPFSELPEPSAQDVLGYVRTLAERSVFFKKALEKSKWEKP
jgi:DNA oxidative demethylase